MAWRAVCPASVDELLGRFRETGTMVAAWLVEAGGHRALVMVPAADCVSVAALPSYLACGVRPEAREGRICALL
jgi:hypothetical protein